MEYICVSPEIVFYEMQRYFQNLSESILLN